MVVITRLLIIYMMIGTGFVLYRTKVFTKENNLVISRIVILVGSPCLIFSAIVQREMTSEMVSESLQMFVATIGFFIGGTILAHILARVTGIINGPDAGVYMALMTTINASFMGFPLMQAAFGDYGLYLEVLANIVFNCYLYSYGIILIKHGEGPRGSARDNIIAMVNPCIIASVLGFVFLCLHIPVPQIIMSPIEQIGNITIPLAMISLGISMGGSNIQNVLHNRDLLITCAMKNFLWPAAAFLAFAFLPMNPLVKSVALLMSTLPPAISTGVLVTKLGKNSQVASQGTVIMILISIITIPVMYAIITHLFPI